MTLAANQSHGLILFAHGARDAAWAGPFERLAARLRVRAPDVPVSLAYLELMTPDLAGAAAQLIGAGCTSISIVPMFLGQGGHVRRDLPVRLDALRASYPEVSFDCATAVGEDDSVLDALANYCLACLHRDDA